MSQTITESQPRIGAAYDEADSEEYTYKTVSRAAVLAFVFALMGLLAWASPLLIFLPAIALVFGLVAIRNLKRYPNELFGMPLSIVSLVICVAVLIGAPAKHIYIYNTEVPDGFERIQFASLKSPLGAPDFPTPEAIALNGKKVFLKGYIHPTSLSSNSSKTFVLVPDWATCCFGTQPPLTHMIEVHLANDKFAGKSFRQHSIAGVLEVHPYVKPIDGLEGVFYQLEAEHFE